MPCPLLIVSQSDSLIQILYMNSHTEWQTMQIQFRSQLTWVFTVCKGRIYPGSAGQELINKKVREKSREYHNHKPQPFPDPKRKRKPTNLNKQKPNKHTKSTKISSLFPMRGNRNTKRTEKDKNKMTHGKTYNK